MVKSYHKVTIEAPISEVLQLLTSVEGIQKWFTKGVSGDASKVDGEIEFGDKEMWYNKMKVSTLSDNEVVWDVIESTGKMEGAALWNNTKISYVLEEKQLERLQGKTVTILLFKHEGFEDGFDDTKQYAEINWHWAYFLHSLKNISEGKEGWSM